MGNFHLRMKDKQTATAFLYKGNEILERIFSDDHPLTQRYYAFAAEVAS